jgi:CheY-like chemotaxis protein
VSGLASNCLDALRLVMIPQRTDVVLMDIAKQGLNGLEVTMCMLKEQD